MKLKLLVLACAVTTATFSFNASANSSVCADPLAKICTETYPQRVVRDAAIQNLKYEISQEANKNAAPRIEEMKKEVSKWRFIRRAIRSYKITNQEIMASAKKRISGFETAVTSPENIALLKKYMKQAIDESKFDQVTKNNFKSTIDSIIIGNFNDFLDRLNLEDDAKLTDILMNPCGSDGLVSNAFATTLNKDKYVLICPGFLLTLSGSSSPEEKLNTVLLSISHEMGHHIDNSKVGKEIYKPYLSCLANNYADQLNKSKDDAKFCKKNPAECNYKVVESHAGEIIADTWGAKVVNIHARTQGYSSGETETLVVDTLNQLCGSGDEGTHPTGDFRMTTLLRMNTDLMSTLACGQEAAVKTVCSIEGSANF
jgi:hypothetical protein